MRTKIAIPVIDLFAGPGGLCEGFSSVKDSNGIPKFNIKISIEKDPVAHRTLHLRALFRKFSTSFVPDEYYQYIRGEISREEFLSHPAIEKASNEALHEAKCAELGVISSQTVDQWISKALGNCKNWVLVGGPPCQAYSLAGRSRMKNKDPKAFEKDKRHFLYTEYLRIIQQFSPPVFVMENVKGMLNSTHKGNSIFNKIINDLSNPKKGLCYEIRSLVVAGNKLSPNDYVIQSEDYGVPQSRHRVVLFGIRSDIAKKNKDLLNNSQYLLEKSKNQINIETALFDIPPIRSRISKGIDSHEKWLEVLIKTTDKLSGWKSPIRKEIEKIIQAETIKAKRNKSIGANFIKSKVTLNQKENNEYCNWITDNRIGGTIQHESRSHMESDLQRYIFASSFAKIMGYPPTLHDFPPKLLPAHANVKGDSIPFTDRFRVQIKNQPACTIVSHIQKDGHYFIHHDPAQSRSLTVREAARLQTFPDNYFFEGNRTQQYGQVGNAVPPLLAKKIAEAVCNLLHYARTK